MPFALIVGLTLLGQQQAYKPDPDQFPLALHRSMEIDDLDREIQRIHDTVLMKKAEHAASQRLAQRGMVSRYDLEREAADVRYQEARESESIAYRALKVYERDVAGQVILPDEPRAYSLILAWVQKQIEMAQVDVDYRAFVLKQSRMLLDRKAVTRQDYEDADLAHNTALAALALSRSREAHVLMELAARRGEKPYDPDEYFRLKSQYLKARVHYFEVTFEGARRRLDIARQRSRARQIPANELALFEKAAGDAESSYEAEVKTLTRHEADRPKGPASKPAERHNVAKPRPTPTT